jgi:hypothetical protein
MLAGNFRFASNYAGTHEGIPAVPRGKVLIALGDMIPVGRARHWPPVQRLDLSQRPIIKRAVSWHIRFAGRAVSVTVTFGSKPDAHTIGLVGAVLASVSRAGQATRLDCP